MLPAAFSVASYQRHRNDHLRCRGYSQIKLKKEAFCWHVSDGNHLQPLVSIVDPSVFLPVDQPASLNESSPLLFNENKKKVKLALQMIDARRSFGRHEPTRSDSRVWSQDDRSKPFRLLCLMTDSPNSAGRAGAIDTIRCLLLHEPDSHPPFPTFGVASLTKRDLSNGGQRKTCGIEIHT